jgi:hypothetical protein
VSLAHDDASRNCPNDDGAAVVAVLDYPNRPAADLWVRPAGCPSASNGSVSATNLSGLSALKAALAGS